MLVCIECGQSIKHPRRRNGELIPIERIHLICKAKQQPPEEDRRLTWLGRLLVRLEPGDDIAFVAKHIGGAALYEAWEKISGMPCGCGDRQKWLNMQWQALVRHYFSEPA